MFNTNVDASSPEIYFPVFYSGVGTNCSFNVLNKAYRWKL